MATETPTRPKPGTAKEEVQRLLDNLPEDSSYDELVHELAFERMIDRGLGDAAAGHTISNDQMRQRIASWAR